MLLPRPDYEHYMQSGTDIPLAGTAQQNIQIFRKHAVVGQQDIFRHTHIDRWPEEGSSWKLYWTKMES